MKIDRFLALITRIIAIFSNLSGVFCVIAM